MVFGSALFINHFKTGELEWREAKKRFPQVQVMFVVINRKGDPAYGKYIFVFQFTSLFIYLFSLLLEIGKKVGDLDLNMTSQCIQWKNVLGRQGPDPSTMANIVLKLNAKLGGINNLIRKDNR